MIFFQYFKQELSKPPYRAHMYHMLTSETFIYVSAYIHVHVYIAYYTHCPCSPYIILQSPYYILIQVIDKIDTETCPLRICLYQIVVHVH